ncbi:MAG TPA: hypothetical protein VLB74_01870 [Flavobacterium sp.]|uniref:hypothetical protein n=1 Tax=Flavobacterium sp. TaxID=239 RepID=UPI002C98D47C|nr:hypothetical protein [Flavobacterium sp.]HSD13376.1 hypothetical protein [Flavobacterium sp.]
MRFYYMVLLFVIQNAIIAQNKEGRDSVFVKNIKILNTDYKDFQVVGKDVYAITKGDSLVVFNVKSNKVKYSEKEVFALGKDRKEEVFYIAKDNQIAKFGSKKQKIDVGFLPYKILFDSQNEMLLITNRGLFYKNQLYEPTNIRPNYRYYVQTTKKTEGRRAFKNPDLVYLDKKSRLWLTYDKGEFGEDILFFDLNKREFFEEDYLTIDVDYDKYLNHQKYFEDLRLAYSDKIIVTQNDTLYKFPNQLPIHNPVKGIAEVGNDIFISQSLFHFSVDSKFAFIRDIGAEGFYKSFDLTLPLLEIERLGGVEFVNEFLGPLSYNLFNNLLYYYSDKGFFKIIEKGNKFEKEFVFKPWIKWSATNRNNLGADINVSKFEFPSAREIIFLTTNNGIGYYNGNEVIYFR